MHCWNRRHFFCGYLQSKRATAISFLKDEKESIPGDYLLSTRKTKWIFVFNLSRDTAPRSGELLIGQSERPIIEIAMLKSRLRDLMEYPWSKDQVATSFQAILNRARQFMNTPNSLSLNFPVSRFLRQPLERRILKGAASFNFSPSSAFYPLQVPHSFLRSSISQQYDFIIYHYFSPFRCFELCQSTVLSTHSRRHYNPQVWDSRECHHIVHRGELICAQS